MAGRPIPSRGTLYAQAVEHLRCCQPQIRGLVDRVGPCTLKPDDNHFVVLARTIVSQQLSTQAAKTICSRLEAVLGKDRWRPTKVLKTKLNLLRKCGLSAAKVLSLFDLAQKISDRTVPTKKLSQMDDDEVRSCLLEVRGIGPWSVDMFLMFSLGRTDVLPVGDFGLRAGVRDLFAMAELPGATKLEELAQPWKPFRSIATWYVWRSRGAVPQTQEAGTAHSETARRKRS